MSTTSAPNHRMFGALLARRLPGANRPSMNLERADQGLFLLWLAFMGLLVFASWLLWKAGAWHRLIEADPTHLTVAIVLLFIGCSLWTGQRAWLLGLERQRLDAGHIGEGSWSGEFLQGTRQPGADRSAWLQVLGEQAHGPHEMAWWLNGIQLKLGLLGKVIGFSILALQLGQMDSFDPSQSAQLLKSLTGGLGIALLTTVTGLTGNILLGLQLMRLDRFADALVADALALSLRQTGTTDGGSDGHRPTGP
ncbi:hypothetical protein [Hydrogenophaga sp. RWCD_12]|uniref:hypothetical protein n=1 Tax=Hydrogenophaga sp. RWCD_12 TaxID=3391190 RepID=UPI003984A9C6